ncbi:galactosylgalactosylxylosylprotein 3-beta-glucuronosyltransferase P isoform X1 [Eupeodes corollae]|uniref:galactosylgalactosylxylosylprotein 3-beta-glucuronosyltransferase P isoform X1 n=1 Tax=Eupeodes corollae TaxID=290404 RepID=UPI002491EA9C|nr:galactosylgalactosylxylosylprotein 3-beta-glucuronosyltransferase P isoform X1 [Eupeodes corollae]XP_055908056.1 galactosylgalactosylxylosylprotein 3-beta-glucuronosyltransferase P isoform X1 [Eupeodes corollae]XP_055908057.1 galactosylgalactosylxylosylprotein 3-beta-glucuronosyltransferase P isoform X1 [Eupeodes corollae]
MAIARSFKMYLTIFIATTCFYMVLYQYHISKGNSVLPAEEIKASKTRAKNRSLQKYSVNVGSTPSVESLGTNNISNYIIKDSTPSATTITTPTTSITTIISTNAHTVKNKTAENLPPPLYIITPTYRRPEQLAELTRLGYTLKHVANLLWLVIEDANKTSDLVSKTLNRIGIPYEYLIAPMPEEYKKKNKAKPRGVSNRNRGLDWLRENATEGVFYFADDDNTYDISIFEQMRYTKKVSMWPVGLVTKLGISSPIIRNGKIDGFYDGWIGGRKYPVDMAGFAVNVKFLLERPKAKMPFKPGYEEDGFLKSLAPFNNTDIELLASECTEILTWHTQTKKNPPAQILNMTKFHHTNLVKLDVSLIRT